ncbi:MAG: methylated-DNA--[protein]-cysteine S-methyltransferase [Chloroflexota bacterium]
MKTEDTSSTATGTPWMASIETSWGTFGAAGMDESLGILTFPGEPEEPRQKWLRRWAPDTPPSKQSTVLEQLSDQLNGYLDGKLTSFAIPLVVRGTAFQLRVWAALQEIEYGTTCSYQTIAKRIGKPNSVRAVGAANGANPIPIIVPCHRVIGANGSLTGYGGGLELKERLLELEGTAAGPLPLFERAS